MAMRHFPMESGERDRQITVEQRTTSTGPSGMPVEDWSTLATMWARKIDVRGRERLEADQMSARYDTRWEVNYRADIDPDLVDVPGNIRLTYQGRTYNIVAASMIGRNEGVEFMTLAKVD